LNKIDDLALKSDFFIFFS